MAPDPIRRPIECLHLIVQDLRAAPDDAVSDVDCQGDIPRATTRRAAAGRNLMYSEAKRRVVDASSHQTLRLRPSGATGCGTSSMFGMTRASSARLRGI